MNAGFRRCNSVIPILFRSTDGRANPRMTSRKSYPWVRAAIRGFIVCWCLTAHLLAAHGEIKRRSDAPKLMSPEESAKRIRLPQDLRVELVAAEPLVQDPTAIAFDPQGRMFVCELHGFNLGLHLEVQKLNRTGVLDRELRRPTISPEVKKEAEKRTYGTIKLLIDDNGDGCMDRAEVWADRLPPLFGTGAGAKRVHRRRPA